MNPYPCIKARPPCQFGRGRVGPEAGLAGIVLASPNLRVRPPLLGTAPRLIKALRAWDIITPRHGEIFPVAGEGKSYRSPKLL